MVLLKEISEGIWGKTIARSNGERMGKFLCAGLPLGPNAKVDVVIQHPIRLTMAALEVDESSSTGITRLTMKSATADGGPSTDLILCNLNYPSCLQQPLDIELYDGQTLSFGVRGPRKRIFFSFAELFQRKSCSDLDRVHVTGYRLDPDAQEGKTKRSEVKEKPFLLPFRRRRRRRRWRIAGVSWAWRRFHGSV